MCGIAGIRAFDGRDDASLHRVAESMAARLRHRGPDDDGAFAQRGVALGFRRLSILDLTPAGAQPMHSASGRYTLVFNGEVYNCERLRAELPSRAWRGHSDTEVMLACFEEWGLERAVAKFIGMFAFALWDRETSTLTLVRDRLGVKPLYYSSTPADFQFASELHALDVERRIDHGAVALYARYGYVPAPWSIYEGVRKLPPGCMLSVSADGRVDVRAYWNPARVIESVPRFDGSEGDAVAQLEALLADAVRLRLISDVPLGVFLSGGVDSSLVTALMRRAVTDVKTFTIGFEDARFDEAPFAREVAQLLGTRHTEGYVSSEEALRVIPTIGAIYDEPFGDSSALPTFLVSRMARHHVTVALSGDGGDELFGGYHRYFLGQRTQRRVTRVPPALRAPIGRAMRLSKRLRNLGEALVVDDPIEMFLRQVASKELPNGTAPPVALTDRESWPRVASPVELMMYLDAVSYLPDDILVKVDRASMAVSLEAREPLLDHRVVEFAWGLPASMKIRDDRGKWILREVLRRHVPDAMVDREKQGFGLPVAEWLRGPLREWAESLLANVEHFDRDVVRALWAEHLGGRDRGVVWRVLMFEQWHEAHRRRGS